MIPNLCNNVITLASLPLCGIILYCPALIHIDAQSLTPHTMSQTNKVCMLGAYRLPVSPLLCCSILPLCQSSGEEKKGGGRRGRNPLANDSWDLGHVLNLDTNVGSFYSPSVICFMCLPNIGTGLASLPPPSISISYITWRSWMSTRPGSPALSPAHSKSHVARYGNGKQHEERKREKNR